MLRQVVVSVVKLGWFVCLQQASWSGKDSIVLGRSGGEVGGMEGAWY